MKPSVPANLVDVFVLRSLAEPVQHDSAMPDGDQLETCLELHGIVRQRSYLAPDGRRLLCHFRAADAESLRMALRVARIDYDEVWTAKVKDTPGQADPAVEKSW